MDGLQAAILSIKLKYIKKWTDSRISHAIKYNDLLSNTEVIVPVSHPKAKHVFHLYVIRLPNRDDLYNFLIQNNISCGIHYPVALPFLEAYSYLNHKAEDFPVANKLTKEILSLPIYPELNMPQFNYISKVVNNYFKMKK